VEDKKNEELIGIMVKIKVTSFFTMKDLLGDGLITLDPDHCSAMAALEALSKKHGEKFTKQVFDPGTGQITFYRIVVNNRQCEDLNAPLKDGDEIQLYPAMAGG
jgi:molybdopterin converting factor small subunit